MNRFLNLTAVLSLSFLCIISGTPKLRAYAGEIVETGPEITDEAALKTAVTVGSNIKVREGKPVTGPVIQTVNGGIAVTIKEEVKGSDSLIWYLIESADPHIYGYVRSDFVSIGGVSPYNFPVDSVLNISYEGVRVRSLPSLSGNMLVSLPYGTKCAFKEAVYDSECGLFWYRVSFDTKNGISEGYVRSDHFSGEIKEKKEEYKDDSFPDSYQSYLGKIHELHPNWVFTAYEPLTGLTFEEAVAAEYGTSVVESSHREEGEDGSQSLFGISPAILSNEDFSDLYETNINGASVNLGIFGFMHIFWSEATKEAIRYYMDPRNFMVDSSGNLNPSFYMFLDGREAYGAGEKGVSKILSTTSMTGDIPNEGNSYAGLVTSLSKECSINPYLIAARMRQEHGSKGGDGLINGTYKGYEGYYNYFNIRANGSNPVENGLAYAKEQGWNSRMKSIKGGISFLNENYIRNNSYNQNTLYKQRFNFKDKKAIHQYMTSLYAPHFEAKHVAEGYGAESDSSDNLHFLIPVYSGMPDTPAAKP